MNHNRIVYSMGQPRDIVFGKRTFSYLYWLEHAEYVVLSTPVSSDNLSRPALLRRQAE